MKGWRLWYRLHRLKFYDERELMKRYRALNLTVFWAKEIPDIVVFLFNDTQELFSLDVADTPAFIRKDLGLKGV